jgi:uncharacterized protein
MGGVDKAVRPNKDGVRLIVRAQPRASRSAITGVMDDGALKVAVAVAAPPVDGAANDAIVELLAGVLGVPRRSVSIARGETGRNKQVDVEGIDVATAIERIRGRLPRA